VQQTFSKDGLLRFGDHVLVKNKASKGVLVFDSGDRITSYDEAYACTTTDKSTGPCARSAIVITKAEEDFAPDNLLRYGQKIRLESTTHLFGKKTYLHSCQISPLAFARFSRNQEVCMITRNVYNTVWKVVHANPSLRISSVGEPVRANEELIIEHCATAQFLSSDKIQYGNEFGTEYEVSVCSQTTNNKSQQLNLEKVGKLTVDQPTKLNLDQNIWYLMTAEDPSLAAPTEEPVYTIDSLIAEIREKIKARGTLGIRGLARMFKILDKNGNQHLDGEEFLWGLKDFGLDITQTEAKKVLQAFDKNRNTTVNFNEFLRAIRGNAISDERKAWVRRAYQKLDVNGDGTVRLDDIAKLYDVSKHPRVISGQSDPREIYMTFMSLWDTQVADGIVTFDEFLDYYRDISASYDDDAAFGAMMRSAWKLE